ncbi:phage baseplate assembly protein V [Laribacter hongkongensis]|uniref:Phage baseplate assembly protein V n=1 Tax=Laribacter hongkongensis TaxID=168471 RepID=A0A248LIF8_9NEIS|nr:phage baseplate assembly protein V [Laribacter hongkongensis]ASJ24315.1 phage baseplate assembly protein V [Laribacter hongkongensis]MCG9041996.1 phage baseplate assembly protein V [Laribacter hongkongensis]MCG9069000.1 phage baseplate assembly protein V [Laribacter hongkongensis]MCG9087718.1 phage baseplate assembly protein V [Laribacter hongkongensis]MCG9110833.1 phage baseplate assembly protein V [Laribacter hongkongensis]
MDDFADLSRRLESLIRPGTIAGVDLARARVRVTSGGLTTDWLPWFSARAGTTRDWNPPTVGEQCVVLAPSGDPATGFVLVGLFSGAHPAPSHNGDERLRVYPDGARITYNHTSGALSATGIKTVLIEASEKCTVDCPLTEFTGDVHIQGKLTVDGETLLKALLTYMAGMAGQGGTGGKTVIRGAIKHDGDFTNRGKVSSNSIVLSTHTHPGDSGGTTGAPK